MAVCEFCIKHGEGKKWYEVMQNYSKELYAQKNREEYIKLLFKRIRYDVVPGIEKAEKVRAKVPLIYRFMRTIGTWKMKQDHFGQVVPLEDAERIVDMVQSITRLSCACRIATVGRQARYCLALGIDLNRILGDFPDLKASLETLTPQEAKKLLREFDKQGLVHSIWTFKTPFIGGICNCDHDCLAYRMQVTRNLVQVMFKGEYIAEIEPSLCVGCRSCLKMCQFGALEYSVMNDKCIVNPMKCYGCGVCRNACEKKAISLIDKGVLGCQKPFKDI
jgi:ferredoxin